MIKKTVIKKEPKSSLPKEYAQIFVSLKQQIQEAQIKAALSVNKELIKLYWAIGKIIAEKQKESKWGTNFIETLSKDLQEEFPGIAGFSRANIFKMQAFYQAYQAYEKVSQPVRQLEDLPFFEIPWSHNVLLITKLKDNNQRLWYAKKTIQNGWSRTMLELWIKKDLFGREGKAITNFKFTLPLPDSDVAQQTLKDPYIFDFLTLHEKHLEQDLEQGLINNVEQLLLELGKGFALVGRQYHLEVGAKDYYIDLLFYHCKLKCFIVVELKAREFDPRDAGQINFYLSAVDDLVKSPEDKPTIGLLLCKTKDNFTAEYALRNINSPIGVAEYEIEIMNKLPKNLKSSLPTIEEIEKEWEKAEELKKVKK